MKRAYGKRVSETNICSSGDRLNPLTEKTPPKLILTLLILKSADNITISILLQTISSLYTISVTTLSPFHPVYNRYSFLLHHFFPPRGLGFEPRALYLQSRCSTARATAPVHFALVSLEMGVSGTIGLGWP
jgi:hypothetical protein